MGTFYVYEHWRPDTNECFYIGKGQARRAWDFRRNRNPHYLNVVKKLTNAGLDVEVRLVENGLCEPDAFSLEVDRIKEMRRSGAHLCNLTDGGEGPSGFKHTEQAREGMRLRLLGKKNPEHSARLKGRTDPEEVRAKKSKAQKGRQVSDETRAKIAKSRIGKRASQETLAKLKASHIGKTHSIKVREKMSADRKEAWKYIDREKHREATKKALNNPATIERMREKALSNTTSPEARERAREYAFRRWRPSPS